MASECVSGDRPYASVMHRVDLLVHILKHMCMPLSTAEITDCLDNEKPQELVLLSFEQ